MASLAVRGAVLCMVIGIVCGFPGCDGTTAGPATVQGTLADDANLEPIDGATASIDHNVATTGLDGTFTLSTTAGEHTLNLSAGGYEDKQVNVSLQEGVNDLGIMHMRPVLLTGRGTVRGRVLREGVQVAGATLTGENVQALSKDDGTFAIYNLRPGTEAIVAIAPEGDMTGWASVQITAGETTTGVTIELTLRPPAPPIGF